VNTRGKKAGLIAVGLVLAASLSSLEMPPSTFALGAQGGISLAGTITTDRPLLPQRAEAFSLDAQWRLPTWIPLAASLSWFNVEPSLPDQTLFLYRGFGGESLCLGTGPLYHFSPDLFGGILKWGSELEILGGGGLAISEDTGTTLVSMEPFLRLEARFMALLGKGWRCSIGLPIDHEFRGATRTTIAGLTLGLGWASGKEGK
jgi:hypothetical protein